MSAGLHGSAEVTSCFRARTEAGISKEINSASANLHPRPEEADGIRRSTPAGIPMSGIVHPRPPCAEAEAPNPQNQKETKNDMDTVAESRDRITRRASNQMDELPRDHSRQGVRGRNGFGKVSPGVERLGNSTDAGSQPIPPGIAQGHGRSDRCGNDQADTKASSSLSFFHEFTPPTATAQTRRHTGRATYLPPATARAQALLRAVMEAHAPDSPLEGPLSVALLWTWPGEGPAWKVTRPDADNVSKLALDAMTKSGFWKDDAQVVDLHVCKFIGPIPGIAVTVSPAGNLSDDV